MISPKGFCREDEPSFEPSLNQLGLGPRRIFVRTGNKHIVSHLSLLHVHVTVSKYIDGAFEQLAPSSALQILSKLLKNRAWRQGGPQVGPRRPPGGPRERFWAQFEIIWGIFGAHFGPIWGLKSNY